MVTVAPAAGLPRASVTVPARVPSAPLALATLAVERTKSKRRIFRRHRSRFMGASGSMLNGGDDSVMLRGPEVFPEGTWPGV